MSRFVSAFRRRPLVALAAATAALFVAGVATDRTAALIGESRTASAFQDAVHTPAPPEVRLRGFPVLDQVVSGELDHVDLTARDIPADAAVRPVPITRLDVRLDGLSESGGRGARAKAAWADAFLSYRDLSDAMGIEIAAGSRDGYVEAEVVLPLVGRSTVTAKVAAGDGNAIRFGDFHAVDGDLPEPGQRLLSKVFERPIPLHGIPSGLRLDSVSVGADGLGGELSGRNVTFSPDDAAGPDGTGAV